MALVSGLVGVAAPPALAAGLVVTTATDVVADDGVCSLREAVEAADTDTASGVSSGECSAGAGADVITFGVPGPFVLSQGQLELDSEVTIDGAGMAAVDANGTSRVIVVRAASVTVLSGLTITGGAAFSGADLVGGGVFNDGGSLSVFDSLLTGNLAFAEGGGIYSTGTTVLSDSEVSSNMASVGSGVSSSGALLVVDSTVDNFGDGIVNTGDLVMLGSTVSGGFNGILQPITTGASMMVSNSTLSGNSTAVNQQSGALTIEFSTVTSNGSGIVASGQGTVEVVASVVAGNTDPGGDVSGTGFSSGGHNVIGHGDIAPFTGPGDATGVTDPKLGPLADTGGSTKTHLPAHDSPAVDRVTASVGSDPVADQRGVPRPQGAAKDAGAVEREDLWVRPFGTVLWEGDSGTTTAHVVVFLEDGNGDPATSITDVTIDYATVDTFPNPQVAQAGSDFIPTAGTLTIPAGASQATVPVEIIGDTVYEPNLLYGEWALLTFTDPSPNARLNFGFFGLGLIIIVNDDPAP